MTMRRQEVTHPYWGSVGLIEPSSRRWHDYDGDEIYADVAIDFDQWGGGPPIVTELAAHEPGIGSYDYASNAASYRHGDQIGSTRAITGEGGMGVPPVTGRIVYTAFGERVWSDGTVGTRYQYAGAWGYQSELYDDASGNLPFVHVGHRWYDPATGRFLQSDPMGILGDLNVYEYAASTPTVAIDPLGLAWWAYIFTPLDKARADKRNLESSCNLRQACTEALAGNSGKCVSEGFLKWCEKNAKRLGLKEFSDIAQAAINAANTADAIGLAGGALVPILP